MPLSLIGVALLLAQQLQIFHAGPRVILEVDDVVLWPGQQDDYYDPVLLVEELESFHHHPSYVGDISSPTQDDDEHLLTEDKAKRLVRVGVHSFGGVCDFEYILGVKTHLAELKLLSLYNSSPSKLLRMSSFSIKL